MIGKHYHSSSRKPMQNILGHPNELTIRDRDRITLVNSHVQDPNDIAATQILPSRNIYPDDGFWLGT